MEIDSQGKCIHHSFVQLQRFSHRTGQWKALLDCCPVCAVDGNIKRSDDDKRCDSGGGGVVIEDNPFVVIPSSSTSLSTSSLMVPDQQQQQQHHHRGRGKTILSSSPASFSFENALRTLTPAPGDPRSNNRVRFGRASIASVQSLSGLSKDADGVVAVIGSGSSSLFGYGSGSGSGSSSLSSSYYPCINRRGESPQRLQLPKPALIASPKYKACEVKMRRQQTESENVPTMSMDLNLSVGTDGSHGEYDSQSSDESILTREPVDGSNIAWELHGRDNDRMDDDKLPIEANEKEKEVESIEDRSLPDVIIVAARKADRSASSGDVASSSSSASRITGGTKAPLPHQQKPPKPALVAVPKYKTCEVRMKQQQSESTKVPTMSMDLNLTLSTDEDGDNSGGGGDNSVEFDDDVDMRGIENNMEKLSIMVEMEDNEETKSKKVRPPLLLLPRQKTDRVEQYREEGSEEKDNRHSKRELVKFQDEGGLSKNDRHQRRGSDSSGSDSSSDKRRRQNDGSSRGPGREEHGDNDGMRQNWLGNRQGDRDDRTKLRGSNSSSVGQRGRKDRQPRPPTQRRSSRPKRPQLNRPTLMLPPPPPRQQQLTKATSLQKQQQQQPQQSINTNKMAVVMSTLQATPSNQRPCYKNVVIHTSLNFEDEVSTLSSAGNSARFLSNTATGYCKPVNNNSSNNGPNHPNYFDQYDLVDELHNDVVNDEKPQEEDAGDDGFNVGSDVQHQTTVPRPPPVTINTEDYDANTGRCSYHPHVRLRKKRLFGRGWKVLMSACPDCCIEELKKLRLVQANNERRAMTMGKRRLPPSTLERSGSTGSAGSRSLVRSESFGSARSDGNNSSNVVDINNGFARSDSAGTTLSAAIGLSNGGGSNVSVPPPPPPLWPSQVPGSRSSSPGPTRSNAPPLPPRRSQDSNHFGGNVPDALGPPVDRVAVKLDKPDRQARPPSLIDDGDTASLTSGSSITVGSFGDEHQQQQQVDGSGNRRGLNPAQSVRGSVSSSPRESPRFPPPKRRNPSLGEVPQRPQPPLSNDNPIRKSSDNTGTSTSSRSGSKSSKSDQQQLDHTPPPQSRGPPSLPPRPTPQRGTIHVNQMQWTDPETDQPCAYTGKVNDRFVPHGNGTVEYIQTGSIREGEWENGRYCGPGNGNDVGGNNGSDSNSSDGGGKGSRSRSASSREEGVGGGRMSRSRSRSSSRGKQQQRLPSRSRQWQVGQWQEAPLHQQEVTAAV